MEIAKIEEKGVLMKKASKKIIKIIIPYLLPVLWFVYCAQRIEESIKNHFGYEWCVFDSLIFAIVSIVVLIIAKLFKKEVYAYYFIPFIFFIEAYVLNLIGGSIPCCTGG